jgi:biofilm PGA synthesis N-glycosyltransferase PgaC
VIAEVAFWVGACVVAYTFVGYPCAIAVLARLRPRPVRRGAVRPSVSLLIAAYNEEQTIARKLDNALKVDYPPERFEIVLASDGSTDATCEIASRYEARGVRVLPFPVRRGKPSVLNEAIPQCRGEVVVLGDARQLYELGAIVALVENFADQTVGAVSGELHLANRASAGVGEGVGFYWRYEKLIRRSESALDSTVGATGAIYAIRRALFEPIPWDTLLDDVLIPLRIARRGYRVVFEPRAKAFDEVAERPGHEFTRKVRTISGNLQLFVRETWLWSPRQNRLWLQALSHKLLRLAAPFGLAALLAASVALAPADGLFRAALLAQLAFYGAALIGAIGGPASRRRCFAVPYAFCLLNVTALAAVAAFVGGRQQVTWRRAADVPMVENANAK